MPIGIRVTDLPAAAGTLDDDDEFLALEDGSLRRATRAQAGPKASIVQVADTANQFTGTNVETVLAEIQDNVDALVISGGGMSVASTGEIEAGTNNTKAVTPAGLNEASLKTQLHDTFAGKANGAIPAADSGHTWTTSGSGGLTVINGEVGNTTGTGYMDTPMGARITRIGGRFTFTAAGTTNGGFATFLAWDTQFAGNPFPPDAPIHFGVSPSTARFSIWDGQVETELWEAAFAERLVCDGVTVHEVDIILEGDTATIRLPDGTVKTITEPRLATLGGTVAGWECFHVVDATDNRPRFQEVWADTRDLSSRSWFPLGALYRATKKPGDGPAAATRMEYTTPGTHAWVVPESATWADVTLVAGGGGGGSGRRGAATTVRTGGGGGQGGGRTKARLWLVPLRGLSLTFNVGEGGAGGAAVTTDDTAGNAGSAGSASWVQKSGPAETLMWAHGGAAGAGGTTGAAAGGAGFAWGTAQGGAGGASSGTGGAGAAGLSPEGTLAEAGGGGGAGGGITAGDAASAGGAGYYQQASVGSAVNAGAAGAVNAAGGAATNATSTILAAIEPPGGGGGGGGGASVVGAAGAGGAGGKYGGGGGGGGASLNGNASGAGGAGGNGAVLVVVT